MKNKNVKAGQVHPTVTGDDPNCYCNYYLVPDGEKGPSRTKDMNRCWGSLMYDDNKVPQLCDYSTDAINNGTKDKDLDCNFKVSKEGMMCYWENNKCNSRIPGYGRHGEPRFQGDLTAGANKYKLVKDGMLPEGQPNYKRVLCPRATEDTDPECTYTGFGGGDCRDCKYDLNTNPMPVEIKEKCPKSEPDKTDCPELRKFAKVVLKDARSLLQKPVCNIINSCSLANNSDVKFVSDMLDCSSMPTPTSGPTTTPGSTSAPTTQ